MGDEAKIADNTSKRLGPKRDWKLDLDRNDDSNINHPEEDGEYANDESETDRLDENGEDVKYAGTLRPLNCTENSNQPLSTSGNVGKIRWSLPSTMATSKKDQFSDPDVGEDGDTTIFSELEGFTTAASNITAKQHDITERRATLMRGTKERLRFLQNIKTTVPRCDHCSAPIDDIVYCSKGQHICVDCAGERVTEFMLNKRP